jgi:uncharacterized protein (DUF58 family)
VVRPARLVNRKVITLLALALAMFLIATNVQAGLLYLVSSGIMGLTVISYLIPLWSVRGITVVRRAPAQIFENTPAAMEAAITNHGRWPRALVAVKDSLAPAANPAAPWVPGRRETVLPYAAVLARGVYREAMLIITCAAPFGVWTARRATKAAADITVFPLYEDIPTLPILEAMSSPAETLHERRSAGAGYDYLGIRDYRRGDSLRVVHWRSSARRGELVVKEFEEEISSPVTLVVAASDVTGETGNNTLDAAARLAATIANYCLRAGHPLQLVGWNAVGGLISLDRPGLPQTLEWLAGLQPAPAGTPEKLAEETALRVAPRSTVILITPSVSADWRAIASALQTRRVRLLTVLIDRQSFGGRPEPGGAANDVADRLTEARSTVYTYRKDESLRACLSDSWRATAP